MGTALRRGVVEAALRAARGRQRTVVVTDLGAVRAAWEEWAAELPGVRPFYAVKCNPDPRVMRALRDASGGAVGFDCASPREIDAALALPGVRAGEDVVYAHPCKHPADVAHAVAAGVRLTTFDSAHELDKIAAGGLRRALLRVLVPGGAAARVDLGAKYGADAWDEAPALLAHARARGAAVAGACFHVGSACTDPSAFGRAVEAAAHVLGLLPPDAPPEVLDIGGGFGQQAPLAAAAPVIRDALARLVAPRWPGLRVVAEPGRFFAERAVTIFTPVIGKRVRPRTGVREYFITDGLYGSFNCVLYDGQEPRAVVVDEGGGQPEPAALFPSNLWGPTCDSADVVARGLALPDLEPGAWIAFPDAGAYTLAGACDFNGIPMSAPRRVYVDEGEDQAEEDEAEESGGVGVVDA